MLFVIVFGGQLADCLRKYFLSTGAVRKIFNTLGKAQSYSPWTNRNIAFLVFSRLYINRVLAVLPGVGAVPFLLFRDPTLKKNVSLDVLQPFGQSTRRIYIIKACSYVLQVAG